ncbi:hypothetical protein ACOSQ2_023782 [Xanthoceras sorbifolium]
MTTFTRNLFNVSLFIFFTIIFFPSASSISFNMLRFGPDDNDILYQGDAAASAGAIELISQDNYTCRVGWATYAESVLLWDSNTGKLSDFSTRFSISIDTMVRTSSGHGLAFFLAPVGFQIPPNSATGFLGLFNTTTKDSSSNHIVMVEFDSYKNPGWDPSDVQDHVGINNNSLSSAVYTRWNSSFHGGDTADVRIAYNATTKNLSVSWTYMETSTSQENTSLFYIIDLMTILPERIMVGFSAATGIFSTQHRLESWEFNSSLDVKETNGTGAQKIRIIVGVTVSVGVLMAVLIVGLLIFRRWKQVQGNPAEIVKLTSINDDLERGAGPRRFSYEGLASATNNFSDDRKLGEGGFGAVYKGYLIDSDTTIAVKKISRGSKQGKKEYVTEVKTISQLRHRNLVQLIGWCHDRGEFLLVYEFMPNGSLDSHLFGKKSPLAWAARYKISLGLGSALLYLHEEWEQCVVHRDIKSSNIMLDSSFSVKLGDFGLARLMDHEIGPKTTGVAGTFGYLAPEYISTGRASKESDVFSFGVVALEIATGRKSADPKIEKPEMGLVEWVWDLYGRGQLLFGVDEKLNMNFDEKQMEHLMIVGLWCAHPDCNFRPSIRQAIQVLNFETAMPNLPTKMPVPMYYVPTPSVSSSEPSITNSSIDVGR